MIYFRDDMKVRFSACGRAERAGWKSVFVPRAPARVGAEEDGESEEEEEEEE